jgi:archaellum biogenesis ATPase FlaH
MADPADIVEFNAHRLRFLRQRGVLTLDNYVKGTLDEQVLNRLRHAYPIIVNLRYAATDGNPMRLIQLGKLKSGQFAGEAFPFIIDPRTGIVVQRRAT